MKVAVLVSGGVDSSVALRLLLEQGHDVTAFYLKIWLEDELSYLGECPWEQDLAYVRAVCEQAQVPLQVISLQKAYHEEVVKYTVAEVKAGRTPNPDMLCNKRIKFGMFFNAIDNSFEKIATGHYAQVVYRDGLYYLYQAPDLIKDQSYFLSQLSQEQIGRILFPIGGLHKAQVRALAAHFGLPNKDRKDSQGICFLGKLKFKDFIKHYLGEQDGALIEFETGAVLGNHKGAWFYTIGQRQGSGLSGGPWYVVAKDREKNNVYISRQYHAPEKQRNIFMIEQCNWISHAPSISNGRMLVKMRHGQHMHQALVALTMQNGVHSALITLSERDQGIAQGQFAVLYDEMGMCYGGGVIGSSVWAT